MLYGAFLVGLRSGKVNLKRFFISDLVRDSHAGFHLLEKTLRLMGVGWQKTAFWLVVVQKLAERPTFHTPADIQRTFH